MATSVAVSWMSLVSGALGMEAGPELLNVDERRVLMLSRFLSIVVSAAHAPSPSTKVTSLSLNNCNAVRSAPSCMFMLIATQSVNRSE